jgi:hypothetical protein
MNVISYFTKATERERNQSQTGMQLFRAGASDLCLLQDKVSSPSSTFHVMSTIAPVFISPQFTEKQLMLGPTIYGLFAPIVVL